MLSANNLIFACFLGPSVNGYIFSQFFQNPLLSLQVMKYSKDGEHMQGRIKTIPSSGMHRIATLKCNE